MQYAGAPGVWLVARVVVHVWRVALNFVGPVAGPASRPKPRVQVPTTPACPPAPVPEKPKGELDGPKCEFFDFKCLFSGTEGASRDRLVIGLMAAAFRRAARTSRPVGLSAGRPAPVPARGARR